MIIIIIRSLVHRVLLLLISWGPWRHLCKCFVDLVRSTFLFCVPTTNLFRDEWHAALHLSHDICHVQFWLVLILSTITINMFQIHGLDWSQTHENQLATSSQDCTVKFFDTTNPRRAENVISASAPVWRARYTVSSDLLLFDYV